MTRSPLYRLGQVLGYLITAAVAVVALLLVVALVAVLVRGVAYGLEVLGGVLA